MLGDSISQLYYNFIIMIGEDRTLYLHIWHIQAIPTYRVYRLYDTGSKKINDAR